MTIGSNFVLTMNRREKNMWKILLVSLLIVIPGALQAQPDYELWDKCDVKVSWSRNGDDAVVTVTVHNKTKKTLVDPVVRVSFFNADSTEVASDAKSYFQRIRPGKKMTMKARIWDYVTEDAVKEMTEGKLEGGYFE